MSRYDIFYITVVVFLVIMGIVQADLLRRALRTLAGWRLPAPWRQVGASLLVVFFVFMAAPYVFRLVGASFFALLPEPVRDAVRMFFYIWIVSSFGTFVLLTAMRIIGALVKRFSSRVSRASSADVSAIGNDAAVFSRRRFLQTAVVGVAAVPFGLSTYGALWERFRFEVMRQDVFIAQLPAPLDGLTIGQISDIHAGKFMTWRQIRDVAQVLQGLQPDLIAVTGDLVARRRHEFSFCLDALHELRAPLGVFA